MSSVEQETMMARFAGRVAVVTGGGGGIGGATCARLASEGAQVAVFDRDIESAQRVAQRIVAGGGQAQALQCDITDRASVDAAVAQVTSRMGAIHVLVNNAG